MAAFQRKKRLSASNVIGSACDRSRLKKMKQGSTQLISRLQSNVSLVWDDKKKSVVAKREQIGISWRQLMPFADSVPKCHSILADVLAVPQEIFEFENLAEVFSCEVWKTNFSEKERSILAQYLPDGEDPDLVIQQLLGGHNFHFGNAFFKWSAALCSGSLHPDVCLHHERNLMASKKAYYLELQKYHHTMIANLQKLKQKWESCQDSDRTDSWIISRKGFINSSMDDFEANGRSRKGEKLSKRNIQQNDGTRYMSYVKVSREHYQRVKSSMKHHSSSIKSRCLNNVLGNVEALNVQPFELYEEEERQKLHEHWMLLTNKDIPAIYASWRKGQFQKLQLRNLLRQEISEKWGFHKESPLQEKEVENSSVTSSQLLGYNETEDRSALTVERGGVENREDPDVLLLEQMNNGAENDKFNEVSEVEEVKKPDYIQVQICHHSANTLDEDDKGGVCISTQKQHLEQVVSVGDSNQFNCTNLELNEYNIISNCMLQEETCDHSGNIAVEDHSRPAPTPVQKHAGSPGDVHFNSVNVKVSDHHVIPKTGGVPPAVSDLKNSNNLDGPTHQGNPIVSAGNVWQAINSPVTFCSSHSVGNIRSSSRELTLGHPQVIGEQSAQIRSVERGTMEKHTGKDILCGHSDETSFFCSYPNHNQNDLFQSFVKGQGNMPYSHQQKQAHLDFPTEADLLVDDCHFPGHLREQVRSSMPLELRQKGVNDIYVHQNVGGMYPDGSRFNLPRQDNLPVNVQGWDISALQMSAPSHPPLNGGMLNASWFPGQNNARGGWSSLEGVLGPRQSTGSRSNSDQSLFSVLSECHDLHSRAHFNLDTSDQFSHSASYIGGSDGGIPTTSNLLQQAADPLHYLSGNEGAAGLKTNNLGLLGMHHQSSGFPDSLNKSFLRSWNH